jgi:signal transduction histidine kinase
MAFVTSDTTGGFLARLLLPLGLLLPILLGALRIGGENAGWYSTRIGVGLFATGFIILFLGTVWWTARLLFRSDTERKQAEEHVREINAELEQRVADRTAELSRVNEELRQANRAKDDFLAALSHELRTPLTPVLMSAAMMESDPTLDPEQREQLAMMRRNVELEARLIDDLLDLTRITRGKLDLHRTAADIHSLINHSDQMVRGDARAKGVSVQLKLEARDHISTGDAARLHQVFWNMLKNAIKFTPAGGEVVVSTTNSRTIESVSKSPIPARASTRRFCPPSSSRSHRATGTRLARRADSDWGCRSRRPSLKCTVERSRHAATVSAKVRCSLSNSPPIAP